MEIKLRKETVVNIRLPLQEAKALFMRLEEPDMVGIMHNHMWSPLGELRDQLKKVNDIKEE